jgi:hypothetical protein
MMGAPIYLLCEPKCHSLPPPPQWFFLVILNFSPLSKVAFCFVSLSP